MRGHIVQRSKGSYSIKISLGKDPATGKYKSQWFTVKGSKKDAEKRLSELLHQLDTDIYMKPGKTTVADYLQRWLADYARPNLSPRSYERYDSIVKQHLAPDLGEIQLSQLRPEHLQRHYSTRLRNGLSARTIGSHHALIHIALKTAVKWGLVGRNIADAVEPPKFKMPQMQTWNEDEVNRFLEAAKRTHYYALFYTALFTGMRRSELLALRWQDIDFVYGQIYVNRSLHQLRDRSYVFTAPKTERSRRTIALPPSAFLVLNEHHKAMEAQSLLLGTTLDDDALVFSHYDGKPLCPNTITYAWVRMAKRAGVRVIRLHDARHTHASLMLKQGIHPKVVQERLGHSTISMTLDTYSHVAPGIQEAAAQSFDKLLNKSISSNLVANQ